MPVRPLAEDVGLALDKREVREEVWARDTHLVVIGGKQDLEP